MGSDGLSKGQEGSSAVSDASPSNSPFLSVFPFKTETDPMKQHPSPKEPPKTLTVRKPAQELTEEQLKQVKGGLNPQPLPPGIREPPDPV